MNQVVSALRTKSYASGEKSLTPDSKTTFPQRTSKSSFSTRRYTPMSECLPLNMKHIRASIHHQITQIKKVNPKRAHFLSKRVKTCKWTREGIQILRPLGLEIDSTPLSDSFPIGDHKCFILGAFYGAIEFEYEGQRKQMEKLIEEDSVGANIQLPNNTVVEGVHYGMRVLSSSIGYYFNYFNRKYKILASGPGEFHSSRVTYRGNFLNNQFHDNIGNAQLIIHHHSRYTGRFVEGKRHGVGTLERYTGRFVEGKRHGVGTLERYDINRHEYYLYFQGDWKNNKPFNGIIYDPNGPISRVKQGVTSSYSPDIRPTDVEESLQMDLSSPSPVEKPASREEQLNILHAFRIPLTPSQLRGSLEPSG